MTRDVSLPPASPLWSGDRGEESSIRFLEDKVKSDPDDFIAYNKLAGYYMQRLRETGNLTYLELASRAAHSSLQAIPAEQNLGGVWARAQAEYAAHDFTEARDDALELIKLDPHKSYPYEVLGDTSLELGDYDEASAAIAKLASPSGPTIGGEIRLARLELLRGNTRAAQQKFTSALSMALEQVPPPAETVAWLRWQLGEVSFSTGDYEAAEKNYRESLTTFPEYFRALGSLGRVRAAQGDLPGAIGHYEHAIRRLPDPTFVAALGDLYHLSGREKDASAQFVLVEQIARLSALNGQLYNRNLALFYADHDLKPEEAYAAASREYETRRDIYGANAVAWTALKAGKPTEAKAAMKEALRLGTQDARLFYHAGMIAQAAGDVDSARGYLKRALALNPQFDPVQSSVARKVLDALDRQ